MMLRLHSEYAVRDISLEYGSEYPSVTEVTIRMDSVGFVKMFQALGLDENEREEYPCDDNSMSFDELIEGATNA